MNMEEQFKEELKALLKKYNVVMSVEEVYFYCGDTETYFEWDTTYGDGE